MGEGVIQKVHILDPLPNLRETKTCINKNLPGKFLRRSQSLVESGVGVRWWVGTSLILHSTGLSPSYCSLAFKSTWPPLAFCSLLSSFSFHLGFITLFLYSSHPDWDLFLQISHDWPPFSLFPELCGLGSPSPHPLCPRLSYITWPWLSILLLKKIFYHLFRCLIN